MVLGMAVDLNEVQADLGTTPEGRQTWAYLLSNRQQQLYSWFMRVTFNISNMSNRPWKASSNGFNDRYFDTEVSAASAASARPPPPTPAPPAPARRPQPRPTSSIISTHPFERFHEGPGADDTL